MRLGLPARLQLRLLQDAGQDLHLALALRKWGWVYVGELGGVGDGASALSSDLPVVQRCMLAAGLCARVAVKAQSCAVAAQTACRPRCWKACARVCGGAPAAQAAVPEPLEQPLTVDSIALGFGVVSTNEPSQP